MFFGAKKKLLFMGLFLLAVVGLPLVLSLSQKSQENRSRASASTTLYLSPDSTTTYPITKNNGDTVDLDVYINPGYNLPSVVKLDLQYDPAILQPAATPFAVNTSAFPTTIEGPVILNDHVYISLSIGADPTKAIQTTTKVGTVTFKALYATSAPSIVAFGNKAQVLSVAKSDGANENVLSTTTPAYISIVNSTYPTPTSYYALTPTNRPYYAPTPTTPYYVPTPTTHPYYAPTPTTIPYYPTPTLTPYATTLSFDVLLHGIGSSGDNANPTANSLSNKTPLHPQPSLEVQVFDDQNHPVTTKTGTITYESQSGSFKGTIDMGTSITQGFYTVKIKEPTHLRYLIPGIQTLIPQTNTSMPVATLIAGDVNNDNVLNILDYNLVIGCYSDLLPPVACNDTTKQTADLNDDGAVNHVDYNLFLREIIVQNGG